jgi:subtilase family serine protease
VVWNDGFGAGGGGVSKKFEMPDFQEANLPASTRRTLKEMRGYPDMALNAGVVGGVIVYLGFLDTAFGPGNNGFYIFGGTSASAPQWAGITAIGNQMKGGPLGFLNNRINRMGKRGALQSLMHDITIGDNSDFGVPGFSAKPGWDLVTGWGTPTTGLLPALIKEPGGD